MKELTLSLNNLKVIHLCFMQIMKKVSVFCFVAILLLSVSGCKDSLNVLAPYKEIPVVYGLIDQNDSVQYIRVNRAYQGSGNVYTMAAQYDSINYPVGTLAVKIVHFVNGSPSDTIVLDTTTSIPVDPGTFSYPKQVLYYTTKKLNANDQYSVAINNKKANNVITSAPTSLLPDVNVTVHGFTDFLITSPIDFTSAVQFPTTIQWITNSSALIYQLDMVFYYNEIDSIKKDTTLKSVTWGFADQTSPTLGSGYTMSIQYSGYGFQQLLKTSIAPPPTDVKRVPLYVEVMFSSGTMDMNTYINLTQPSLDINQEKPSFTNLKNAVGIFTARHTQMVKRPLTATTIDTLVDGSFVHGLNFKVK